MLTRLQQYALPKSPWSDQWSPECFPGSPLTPPATFHKLHLHCKVKAYCLPPALVNCFLVPSELYSHPTNASAHARGHGPPPLLFRGSRAPVLYAPALDLHLASAAVTNLAARWDMAKLPAEHLEQALPAVHPDHWLAAAPVDHLHLERILPRRSLRRKCLKVNLVCRDPVPLAAAIILVGPHT